MSRQPECTAERRVGTGSAKQFTLSPDEAAREGFVTAEYTLDCLQALPAVAPSIVATDGGAVVGYALVTDRAVGMQHPLLANRFEVTDPEPWRGAPMAERPYVVCGPLCVAKSHRGLRLVDRMYAAFRYAYAARYSHLVADVASDNPRQLRAHERVGFTVLKTVPYGGDVFELLMHPHVIGHRSRIWILERIIEHAKGLGGAWFGTHAQVAQWAKDNAV